MLMFQKIRYWYVLCYPPPKISIFSPQNCHFLRIKLKLNFQSKNHKENFQSSPSRITRGEGIYTSSSDEDQPQKTPKKPGYKIFSRETALQKTQTHPQIQVEEKIQVDHRNMSIDETISKYRDYLDEDLINQVKRRCFFKYKFYLFFKSVSFEKFSFSLGKFFDIAP